MLVNSKTSSTKKKKTEFKFHSFCLKCSGFDHLKKLWAYCLV